MIAFERFVTRKGLPSTMSSLSIRKWYFDCVDAEGNVSIAYQALLRWKSLTVSYGSVSNAAFGRELETREQWRPMWDRLPRLSPLPGRALPSGKKGTGWKPVPHDSEPVVESGSIDWRAPSLGVSLSMTRRAPSFATTLAEDVRWSCVMPSAAVTLSIDGKTTSGEGYAEILELDVAPWTLPIDELRWGRFVSPECSIVWIEWRGAKPLLLTLVNGIETAPSSVTDDEIMAGDHRLQFESSAVIRDATIGETLRIGRLPLPGRFADSREVKRCSRGIVRRGDVEVARGWIIDETVSFR